MRQAIRRGAAFGAATLAALTLLVAAPAYAHNYLVESTPLEGDTLTVLPDEFSVTTNDTLLDLAGDGGGFAIQILDSSGGYYGDGCFTIRDSTLSTGATLGEAGDYRMLWQLVSADGHTVSDEIDFTWEPDADQTISDPLSGPPACGGGTLEESTPPADATDPAQDDADSDAAAANAGTVVLVGGAVALVLVAGVAIFLITAKRNKDEKDES
ncbi:copper resistance CopC family protein [Salinibacterium sp. SWN248]|uniref:copper resistance CopC family protein n=1 Tax=Salinibacterium sp. SWN248 TaxID=2792056 RepID=UPI0018CF8AA0|nr:copper resistance CopC family protein [Salinibacterium sp. SWN248]MBH0023850.1 copper resistance protein CopC [Salinibacterium sp. SWN248]